MKNKLLLCFLVLFILLGIASLGFSRGADFSARDLFVFRKIDGRGGIPFFWNGFVVGSYGGTTQDCIKWNYTGSGHYILNMQGNGSSVFTVDKNGNLVLSGSLTAAGVSGTLTIPDLDGTHFLTFKWNENDTSNRQLAFKLFGANRQLSLEGDSILNQDLTTDASSTFAGLTLSGLTASRLIATNGAKTLSSSDLASWITGTANQITVNDDGDGTVTLSTPQDINTGASPTFANCFITTELGVGNSSPDNSLHIGDATNKMVVNPTGGGITYSGTARPTRYISLDVNNVTVYPDGTNNLGVVTVEYDNTNHRSFVRWKGTNSTQDIDFIWEFEIPDNFSAWAAANSLSVDIRKDVVGDTATLYMYDNSGTVDPGINGADITPGSVDTWTIANDQPTATYSAGDWVRIRIVAYNGVANQTVDTARLSLNYRASN